jgi:1-acyl-sn-glycerol-3-phosphate acyltransferase
MRRLFQVAFSATWKVRVLDRRHEPASGGVVYICNHQSFLDPILMSMALRRPMSYMARDSLFRSAVFRAVIRSLGAFPVKRDTADTGALKEGLRRLKAGGQLVVFAEGTRTRDGRIGPLLPGVALLAQRAAEWTVPVVIDGALECWPRWRRVPRPGSIVVRYGPPVHRSQAQLLGPQELLSGIRDTMILIQSDVRRRLGKPPLLYAGPTGKD